MESEDTGCPERANHVAAVFQDFQRLTGRKIDRRQLITILNSSAPDQAGTWTDASIDRLVEAAATGSDGGVEYDELLAWVFGLATHGHMGFHVRLASGELLTDIIVSHRSTGREVKDAIARKIKPGMKLGELVHGGQTLCNDKTVAELGISSWSTLFATITDENLATPQQRGDTSATDSALTELRAEVARMHDVLKSQKADLDEGRSRKAELNLELKAEIGRMQEMVNSHKAELSFRLDKYEQDLGSLRGEVTRIHTCLRASAASMLDDLGSGSSPVISPSSSNSRKRSVSFGDEGTSTTSTPEKVLGPAEKVLGPAEKTLGPADKTLGPADKTLGPAQKTLGLAVETTGGVNLSLPGKSSMAARRGKLALSPVGTSTPAGEAAQALKLEVSKEKPIAATPSIQPAQPKEESGTHTTKRLSSVDFLKQLDENSKQREGPIEPMTDCRHNMKAWGAGKDSLWSRRRFANNSNAKATAPVDLAPITKTKIEKIVDVPESPKRVPMSAKTRKRFDSFATIQEADTEPDVWEPLSPSDPVASSVVVTSKRRDKKDPHRFLSLA